MIAAVSFEMTDVTFSGLGRICLNVGEHGFCAYKADTVGGRNERERRADNLVSWSNLQTLQEGDDVIVPEFTTFACLIPRYLSGCS
jgi:hypothetical protein